MKKLPALVSTLDAFLGTSRIADYPGAVNGLQIANGGSVSRIVAAVDACERVIREASRVKGTLLIVHHGLFWSGAQPVTGALYRKMKAAIEGDLALYSSHLPLDLHSKVGNNALLAKALGIKSVKPALELKGQPVGVIGIIAPETRDQFAKRLSKAVGGDVHFAPGGPP